MEKAQNRKDFTAAKVANAVKQRDGIAALRENCAPATFYPKNARLKSMTLSAKTAHVFTKYFTNPGPVSTIYDATATVAELRAQAKRAPKFVAEITQLAQAAKLAAQIPVLVVDRAKWAQTAGTFIDQLSYRAKNAQTINFGTFGKLTGAALVSFAAHRLLGQFDPFGQALATYSAAAAPIAQTSAAENAAANLVDERGALAADLAQTLQLAHLPDAKLLLVAPNLAKFRDDYNLDHRDLALWVSVHELTHAVQFIQAPWLSAYLVAQMEQILSLTAAATEQQVAPLIEHVQNLMSVLEGHAQYVMNVVPLNVLPSRNAIIAALAKKRTQNSWISRKLTKMFGFDQKIAQYQRGEEFVKYVVAHAGMQFFNQIWQCPQNFPKSAEFAEPQLWIARIENSGTEEAQQ